jgi:hypothetical protein
MPQPHIAACGGLLEEMSLMLCVPEICECAKMCFQILLYRVPEILTLGRFPYARESDSTWRTQEVRHVGSDTIAPRFWCVPAAWFGEEDERRPQARRLLALAAIYDGATRTEAAMIGGVGLQIIRDWVLHFNERGPDLLLN